MWPIAQKSAPEDYVEILWPNARLIFDDVAGRGITSCPAPGR